MKFAHIRVSEYFTFAEQIFHSVAISLARRANFVEKSTCLRKCFFLGRVSDLDAKPCVADLDAHRFCKGYNNPLAMMGVALDRYLPGRNAMLATKPM